jgi:SAM-dependent methyltransferase
VVTSASRQLGYGVTVSDRRLPLHAGRSAFGVDAEVYDRARPPYRDELYDLLEDEGLIEGQSILEVGAGTGAATLELARRGAREIVAVEPDPRLAAVLEAKAAEQQAAIEVLSVALEEMEPRGAVFDLVASATAFHWVDEAQGLAFAAEALRPGGAIALWWMVFGDPERDDPFHEATRDRVSFGVSSPSAGVRPGLPHALDTEARISALGAAGFAHIRYERWIQTARFTPRQIRELYSTFSQNQELSPEDREALLDDLEDIATREFGGSVERPILNALYLARRRP